MKICINCGDELTTENQTNYRAKNYIHKCTPCVRAEKAEWKREKMKSDSYRMSQASRSLKYNSKMKESNPVKYSCKQMYSSCAKRAKAIGLPININTEYLESIAKELCPIMGYEIKYGGGDKNKFSASLDRIIPERGYVKGNVQIVTNIANMMKSCANKEDLDRFASWVKEKGVASDSMKK